MIPIYVVQRLEDPSGQIHVASFNSMSLQLKSELACIKRLVLVYTFRISSSFIYLHYFFSSKDDFKLSKCFFLGNWSLTSSSCYLLVF